MSEAGSSADHAWTRLWRTGAMHSCIAAIDGNYDGAIRHFWESVFEQAHDGDRIVDIGTGNGAIPLLAKDHASRRGIRFELHGADVADIDPASLPDALHRYEGIVFHPRTSATHLPFQAAEVDLLTSQYAFEYAPRDATLDEIARVVRPNGRIALVVHTHDSIIARITTAQLQHCRYLFEESGLFDATRSMLALLTRARTPEQRSALGSDPHAEAVRHALNAAADGVMTRARQHPAGTVPERAIDAVRGALGFVDTAPDRAFHSLSVEEARLRDEWTRLRLMQDAILDADALHALAAAFEHRGFCDLSLSPLDQREGARMGWTVMARHG